MKNNIYPFEGKVSAEMRQQLLKQHPALFWFTGLSGSGKSTLAVQVEYQLHRQGYHVFLLDGDNVRSGLNQDLGFSIADRNENIRRLAEVSQLFLSAGVIVLAAFISPLEKERELVRQTVGADRYFDIFVDTPIAECERRDVKGLYQKARAGEIKDFTGISSPYEAPTDPFIKIDTLQMKEEEAVKLIVEEIVKIVSGER
ncbi:MAG: adenylyl-sulfate kinase [Cyclobacteriaceae bacterium]|nr:adenylyl-sulfate kinase [Cyclobacteriaceae bacterium]MCH8517805.1 adenylyl-sulfate kinase [Cyclobacteriaceae bacterium]